MEAVRCPQPKHPLRTVDQTGFGEIPGVGHQGGSSLAVSRNSKNPDAAWIFMQWATSYDTQVLITALGGGTGPTRAGQPLVCGMRPADLMLSEGGDIEGELVLAEKTGADLNLHLTIGGADFVATAPRDASVTAGEAVRLHVAPEKLHIFNAETDRRL